MPGTCNGSDRFGLLFCAPDNDRGYVYGLTCDGRYSLTSWDGEATKVIADFASNDAIKVGPGEVNRIGVIANEEVYGLYAKGVLLTSVNDDLFVDDGKIGFFVRSATSEGFEVKFVDLAVWLLEEE